MHGSRTKKQEWVQGAASVKNLCPRVGASPASSSSSSSRHLLWEFPVSSPTATVWKYLMTNVVSKIVTRSRRQEDKGSELLSGLISSKDSCQPRTLEYGLVRVFADIIKLSWGHTGLGWTVKTIFLQGKRNLGTHTVGRSLSAHRGRDGSDTSAGQATPVGPQVDCQPLPEAGKEAWHGFSLWKKPTLGTDSRLPASWMVRD